MHVFRRSLAALAIASFPALGIGGPTTVVPVPGSTSKAFQLTGEYDQAWQQPAPGLSSSRFSLLGTDLGASFVHDGRLWFLFGDSTEGRDLTGFSGVPSLIQGHFGSAGMNFELLVPLAGGGLGHLWRDNDAPYAPCYAGVYSWNGPVQIDAGQVDAISLWETNYGSPGNLEAVGVAGDRLIYLYDDGTAWNGPFPIVADRGEARGVRGTPAFLQGPIGNQGNFEVLVPRAGGGLAYFWRDNDAPGLPWHGPIVIAASEGIFDGVSMIRSNYGNLDAVCLSGGRLLFLWLDGSGWHGPFPVIADGVAVEGLKGNPSFIQSRFGLQGNFEVLAPRAAAGLAHYWRDNDTPDRPWHGPNVFADRSAGFIDAVALIASSFGDPGDLQAVARVGAHLIQYRADNTGWHDEFDPIAFHQFTQPCQSDSIASVPLGMSPDAGFSLDFVTGADPLTYLSPTVHDVTLGAFEVPTGGFSGDGGMYVFFTTDHYKDGDKDLQGKSVLGWAADPTQEFRVVCTVSDRNDGEGRYHFINAAPWVVDCATIPGLPRSSGQGVLIWGSGRYRQSDVYLAFAPLDTIGSDTSKGDWRYYAGREAGSLRPVWSLREEDSMPLFLSGQVGELSAGWNEFLGKWIILYAATEAARGIQCRTADAPWGPWSGAQLIYDPFGLVDGYGAMLHAPGADFLQDTQFGYRDDAPGGEYGPYLIAPFSTGTADGLGSTIFYVMSTWNPYNTVVMRSGLQLVPGAPILTPSANPSLIQGTYGQDGNLELIVPRMEGGIAHLWRNGDVSPPPWSWPIDFGFEGGSFDAVSLIQSNFDDPGNLEVVGRVGNGLYFLWRDPSGWHGTYPIIADGSPATGAGGYPSFIQSRYGSKGNFEVVTPVGQGLAHFFRDNDSPDLAWHGPYYFGAEAGSIDAAALIESNFGDPGHLEVVARAGDRLLFFFDDGEWHGPYPVQVGGVDATGIAGNVALVQGGFGVQGNFEVIAPLASGGIGHWWRDNDSPDLPWHGPVIFGTELGPVDAVTLVASHMHGEPHLEVIARSGARLVHYWRGKDPASYWQGPFDLLEIQGGPVTPRFVRADINGDGAAADISDAIALLSYAYLDGAAPPCLAAADVNGDGVVDGITDTIALLFFIFLDGLPPAPPFPGCDAPSDGGDFQIGCAAATGSCG